MRVALDTNPLYVTRAGIARYVRELATGLRALPNAPRVTEIGWPVENFGYAQPARALKTAWRELWWAPCVAPGLLRGSEVELVHHTAGPLLPFVRGLRHVVTLHDLALLRHPARFRPWQRASGARRLRRMVRADRVICVSRFTADEAMSLLGLPAGRIEVVHHGVTLAEKESLPAGLPPEFYLFVGSLEPGKNLAFLKSLWLEHGRDLAPLVVVGTRWPGVADEGGAPAGWVFLGHQPDEVLLALYRRARALLFPSLYEGFGLPLIEAMAAGCPVVCAPRASLPEVAGGAACLTELQTDRWRQALRDLSADPEDWRQRGLVRAREFSWERCARETFRVYQAAVAP
ncbi:MAG: glycosyltransferase family 4 protein [Opitutae bacterium]|nr:glycosyltransferase family 4 protein [Opitutae bacterium]